MPTYVYECKKCEKVFEVEQRIVEDALTDCDCGAKGSLRRLIQPIAVMFKGDGFYVNDSVKKGEGKSEAADTEVKAESVSAPETSVAAKETGKPESGKAEKKGKSETKSESKKK